MDQQFHLDDVAVVDVGDIDVVGVGDIDVVASISSCSTTNYPEGLKCPICLSTLRKPVQAIPCGHRFCKECIETVKKNNPFTPLLCPQDRGEIEVFPDAAKEREILNLKIKCVNKTGCHWTGELRRLQEHLKSCEFQQVACKNPQCSAMVEKRNMNLHLQTECLYRVVKCPFCGFVYLYVNEKLHQSNCEQFPVECDYKCGISSIPRNQMDQHTKEACKNAIHQCKYANIGCNKRGPRAFLREHSRTDTERHLSLAIEKLNVYEQKFEHMDKRMASMERMMAEEVVNRRTRDGYEEIDNTVDEGIESRLFIRRSGESERDKRTISQVMDSTDNSMSSTNKVSNQQYESLHKILPVCPYTFVVGNVTTELQMAMQENKKVYSKPFYCLGGYRAQLKIFFNGWGSGKSTYVSVYVKFLPGPFNDYLEWPFQGVISISLKGADGDRHVKTMNSQKIMEQDYSKAFHKPITKPTQGKGFSKFLSHKQISKFVMDDEMTFTVNVSSIC